MRKRKTIDKITRKNKMPGNHLSERQCADN